jgi:hydrogenase maturation protease
VAQRLARRPLPAGVRVVDFGIRGVDLAFALAEGCEAAVLVDAAARGGAPGTLYVLELDPAAGDPGPGARPVEPHGMDLGRVLGLVRAMGVEPGALRLVGCEPATFGGEEGALGLSPAVAAAVEPAIGLVEAVVAELCGEAAGRA